MGKSDEVRDCHNWLRSILAGNWKVYLPEIADYEVRRELIRLRKATSVNRLDALQTHLRYLAITTEAMRMAADKWAEIRQAGLTTADHHALDADVILVSQALTLQPMPSRIVVATSNPKHLSRFLQSDEWSNITP
jgi:hypothetical protein